MEAAIAARQEAEARAAHLEDRLKQAATPTGPGGVTHGNIAAIAKVRKDGFCVDGRTGCERDVS